MPPSRPSFLSRAPMLGLALAWLFATGIPARADLVNRWSFNKTSGSAAHLLSIPDSLASAPAVVTGTGATFTGTALRLPGSGSTTNPDPAAVPTVQPDAITVNPCGKASISVRANDTGAVALQIVQGPQFGTATLDAFGGILYTHTSGTPAGDSFTYRAQNLVGFSAPTTVTATRATGTTSGTTASASTRISSAHPAHRRGPESHRRPRPTRTQRQSESRRSAANAAVAGEPVFPDRVIDGFDHLVALGWARQSRPAGAGWGRECDDPDLRHPTVFPRAGLGKLTAGSAVSAGCDRRPRDRRGSHRSADCGAVGAGARGVPPREVREVRRRRSRSPRLFSARCRGR